MTSVAARVGLGLLIASATAVGLSAAGRAGPGASGANSMAPVAPHELGEEINRLGQGFDGRVGIAVKSIDDGWSTG